MFARKPEDFRSRRDRGCHPATRSQCTGRKLRPSVWDTRGAGGSHTQSHVLQLPGKGSGCTQLSPLARRPPTPETPPLETPSCLRLAGVRTTHAQTGSDFEVAVSKLKVQFLKKQVSLMA